MNTHENRRDFASDNWAPVHPAIMEAINACNYGHVLPYGDDHYTKKAEQLFDELFGRKVYTYFVWNGTGANVAALAHVTRRYGAILCTSLAHINCNETAAVEHMTGNKLITFDAPDCKLKPEQMTGILDDVGSQHRPQPGVVSITQTTELGTVYQPEEVAALGKFAHENGMKLHMDGARIANAAAALDCNIADFTVDAGVDVLCFGGTKNALLCGEAIIFFDETLAKDFEMTRKNCGQLSCKNRFIAAQFIAMLQNDLWIDIARQSNKMAAMFAASLKAIDGVEIVQPVESNQIFLHMPEKMVKALASRFDMHGQGDLYRLVTSFDTQNDEIDEFLSIARNSMK